jgi:hypothetical protein
MNEQELLLILNNKDRIEDLLKKVLRFADENGEFNVYATPENILRLRKILEKSNEER